MHSIIHKVPDIFDFFGCLKIVSLNRGIVPVNSSNTDVVEKVISLVAASQHRGTSMAEGST